MEGRHKDAATDSTGVS